MIDHITLPVGEYERSKAWYDAALAPLGYACVSEVLEKKLAGYATEDKLGMRDFWIREDSTAVRGSRYCIAFRAANKEEVDHFYEVALAAGGKDNGAPGYREEYHSKYYAAFVYDLDGYNIEAVFDDIN